MGTDVKTALAKLDSATFTNVYVLDRVPAIFESREQYADWRSKLGVGLEVDPLCLTVVGSTSVGVSLSPRKLYQPFHQSSDVDVAVISARHFDEAWRYLRSLGPLDRLKGHADINDLFKWHRKSLVFDGTIATDRLLPYLPFGASWQTALGGAARLAPTQDRDIKARIYRDFDSLREYHRKNIEQLKTTAIAAEESSPSPDISIEERSEE